MHAGDGSYSPAQLGETASPQVLVQVLPQEVPLQVERPLEELALACAPYMAAHSYSSGSTYTAPGGLPSIELNDSRQGVSTLPSACRAGSRAVRRAAVISEVRLAVLYVPR